MRDVLSNDRFDNAQKLWKATRGSIGGIVQNDIHGGLLSLHKRRSTELSTFTDIFTFVSLCKRK